MSDNNVDHILSSNYYSLVSWACSTTVSKCVARAFFGGARVITSNLLFYGLQMYKRSLARQGNAGVWPETIDIWFLYGWYCQAMALGGRGGQNLDRNYHVHKFLYKISLSGRFHAIKLNSTSWLYVIKFQKYGYFNKKYLISILC